MLEPVSSEGPPAPDVEPLDEEMLADGGAAMNAYGRLQYQMLDATERSQLESALLRYCELDTLAMVMIWEAWRSELELNFYGDQFEQRRI